jgi:hypothetical protein
MPHSCQRFVKNSLPFTRIRAEMARPAWKARLAIAISTRPNDGGSSRITVSPSTEAPCGARRRRAPWSADRSRRRPPAAVSGVPRPPSSRTGLRRRGPARGSIVASLPPPRAPGSLRSAGTSTVAPSRFLHVDVASDDLVEDPAAGGFGLLPSLSTAVRKKAGRTSFSLHPTNGRGAPSRPAFVKLR